MKRKWMGSQIVLNNVDNSLLQKKDYLRKKLSLAKDFFGLDTLIIWPNGNKKNLDLIKKICSDFNINTYLWYPILADISLFRIRPEQAVETFNGLQGYGIKGRWNQLGQEGEDFFFLCPNNQRIIGKIFTHYQEQISEGYFDGVFLDRIRFPSPANGLENLFTCFCQSCQDEFYVNYHEDLNNYRTMVKDIIKEIQTINLNDLANYNSFSDILIKDNLKKFFIFRKQSIYQITKKFADEAKRKGKLVGLDLFAPSLASLVAQDYQLLAKTCDWLKPMVYCHTTGPAGLPLELYCFIRALLDINQNLNENKLLQEFSRLLGVPLPGNINSLLKNGIPENIIYYEVQRIKNFNLPKKVSIHIGLEAVQIPGIANINSSILEKYLSSVMEIGIDGIVISWDLLKIPDENLKVVGDLLLTQS